MARRRDGSSKKTVAEEVFNLIFEPGFSTAETTTLTAGRGMGLDIVLARVRRLGGTVRLSNLPGEGLEVIVEIPIDGGVASALWVRAGEHRVADRLAGIARLLTKLCLGQPQSTAAQFEPATKGRIFHPARFLSPGRTS